MTRKVVHASVDDWVANQIIDACPGNNKSEWVQQLIIKGWMQIQKEQELADAAKRESFRLALESDRPQMKKERIRPADGWSGATTQDLVDLRPWPEPFRAAGGIL